MGDQKVSIILLPVEAGNHDRKTRSDITKDLVEPDEPLIEGGNRELTEEIGYGAREW